MLKGDTAQIVAVHEDVSFHGLRRTHLGSFLEGDSTEGARNLS